LHKKTKSLLGGVLAYLKGSISMPAILILIAFVFTSAAVPLVAGDHEETGRGNRAARMMERMAEAAADRSAPGANVPRVVEEARKDEAKSTVLRSSLNREFRGRERSQKQGFIPGLNTAFSEAELEPLMGDIESLLRQDCSAEDSLHSLASTIKKLVEENKQLLRSKTSYKKLHSNVDFNEPAEDAPYVRRLALIAFLVRESDSHRSRTKHYSPTMAEAMDHFKAEFSENHVWAAPFEGVGREALHPVLRKIIAEEGEGSLSLYGQTRDDFFRGADAYKTVEGGSENPLRYSLRRLNTLFELAFAGGSQCASAEVEEALLRSFAEVFANAEWSPSGRKALLETILGRAPSVEVEEKNHRDSFFHHEKIVLKSHVFDKDSRNPALDIIEKKVEHLWRKAGEKLEELKPKAPQSN
jgi:hypothetical protein